MENALAAEQRDIRSATPAELDALWEQAKRETE
jgi:hypothetical protein